MLSKKSLSSGRLFFCLDTRNPSGVLTELTEWSEFRMPNYKVMEKLMLNKIIFDGRNIYDPNEMKENGYVYYSIGRANVTPEKY